MGSADINIYDIDDFLDVVLLKYKIINHIVEIKIFFLSWCLSKLVPRTLSRSITYLIKYLLPYLKIWTKLTMRI